MMSPKISHGSHRFSRIILKEFVPIREISGKSSFRFWLSTINRKSSIQNRKHMHRTACALPDRAWCNAVSF